MVLMRVLIVSSHTISSLPSGGGKCGGGQTCEHAQTGLLCRWEAAGVRPGLGGGLDEGGVEVFEDGGAGVVRGVEEDEVGLDFEGVWVGGLVGTGCGS